MVIHNNPKQTNLNKYRKDKCKMLKQFGVYLSDTEKQHMSTLTTEISIDNFCRSAIDHALKTHI